MRTFAVLLVATTLVACSGNSAPTPIIVYVTPEPTTTPSPTPDVTPSPSPDPTPTPTPTPRPTPPDAWMEPVCEGWSYVASLGAARRLQDVLDAMNAGDISNAGYQFDEIADAAQAAQVAIRDVPDWTSDGAEYVTRLGTTATTLRAASVALRDVLFSYPFVDQSAVKKAMDKLQLYQTKSNSLDRMGKSLTSKYGFDCEAWYKRPAATPTPVPRGGQSG